MSSQLCSEVNGGGCKNKVSARNGFVCAAGHSKSSVNNVTRPAISISKMSQNDRRDLAKSTEDEDTQLELFRTGDRGLQEWLAGNPSISEATQLELFRTGDRGLQEWLAGNPSISEDIQWELFRTGDVNVKKWLAVNLSIGEDLQLELFRTGDRGLQEWLAGNPSISEDIQLELFRTGDSDAREGLALNPSIGRDIAIELAKVGQAPSGYTKNKSIAELVQPENLALLNQYPEALSAAYLDRLLYNGQEGKEESKALTLYSYFVYEKSGGKDAESYKGEILERYAGDQEIALIISTEPAQ